MRKLLLVLVAMMLVSGTVLAQDATTEVFCGDLAEADCAILTQSQAAMANLDSVAFDLQAEFTIAGVPDVEGPASFTLASSGAFSGDATVLTGMPGDLAAMQDPAEAMTMAVEALRAFDADVSFTLAFPAALLEEEPDMPESITLEIRFVDGTGYINLEPLAPLFESDDSTFPSQGWMGLDIASLIETLVEQNPEMFEELDMGEMGGLDPNMYAQFSDPNTFGQYATITRTDDGSGDTATFETTFDFAGLFSSPEFQSLMQEQMAAQGEDVDPEEFQQGMEAAQAMFANSTMTATSSVDVATGYQTSSTFNMTLDTTALVEAMAEESGEEPEEMPVITINFALDLSQFNEVAEITAPEGAVVLPYMSLLGMAVPPAEGS